MSVGKDSNATSTVTIVSFFIAKMFLSCRYYGANIQHKIRKDKLL